LSSTNTLPVYLSCVLFNAFFLCSIPIKGEPQFLSGTVRHGPSDAPLSDIIVRVGNHFVQTDDSGTYFLPITEDRFLLELHNLSSVGSDQVLRQFLSKQQLEENGHRELYLVGDPETAGQGLSGAQIGWPTHRIQSDLVSESRNIYSALMRNSPLQEGYRLVLPPELPEHIRVARRESTTCVDPILYIEEVDLDTYAAGVVTAEIGVFAALTSGAESQLATFKAFAIAARSYALWFWAGDPDAEYHLDDTACNQRYVSGPYTDLIWQAVQETTNFLLLDRDTLTSIDKYEYAASCGRYGTWPEHNADGDYVPDDTGTESCTSSGWCGHNDCAAHQDNPYVEGDDACLVRGICQWGASERSALGATYLDILEHYQPNLDVVLFGMPSEPRLLGVVRKDDFVVGPNIEGAIVSLDTGEVRFTNSDGSFIFDPVEPGIHALTVDAEGFESTSLEVFILDEIDNWASVVLFQSSSPNPDPSTGLDFNGDPFSYEETRLFDINNEGAVFADLPDNSIASSYDSSFEGDGCGILNKRQTKNDVITFIMLILFIHAVSVRKLVGL
jgi:hypothetical protein